MRLIEGCERERFNEEVVTKHYLKKRQCGGVIRYVAENCGQWVALLTFNLAAYHLKLRD